MIEIDNNVVRVNSGFSDIDFNIRLVLKENKGIQKTPRLIDKRIDPVVEFYDSRYSEDEYGRFINSFFLSVLAEKLATGALNKGLLLDAEDDQLRITRNSLELVFHWIAMQINVAELEMEAEENNNKKEEVEFKRLHSYFIRETICGQTDPQKDVENLLNWAMGADFADPNFHELIYETVKAKYYIEKELEKENEITNNSFQTSMVDYSKMLKDIIAAFNKIAPEGTELASCHGTYRFSKTYGPPIID